jgi:hypothetical protein
MKDLAYLLLIESKKNTWNQLKSKIIAQADLLSDLQDNNEISPASKKELKGKEDLLWELLDNLEITFGVEIEELESKLSCGESSGGYFQFLQNWTPSA